MRYITSLNSQWFNFDKPSKLKEEKTSRLSLGQVSKNFCGQLYIENIRAFKIAFMALGISVTPKVHCVFRHVQEFCETRKCGLGVYSEQVVEASHYDFAKVERWYPTNLKTDPRCAEKLLNAVTRYNGSHLPINQ